MHSTAHVEYFKYSQSLLSTARVVALRETVSLPVSGPAWIILCSLTSAIRPLVMGLATCQIDMATGQKIATAPRVKTARSLFAGDT